MQQPAKHPAADAPVGAVVFASKVDEPKYLAAEFCNVESINGQALGAEPFRLEAASSVRGWLADGKGRVLEQPTLVLSDEEKALTTRHPLTLALSRPDVIKGLPGKPIPQTTGFELRLDPSGLPSKSYRVYLTYRAGNQWYACDNGRVLVVP